MVTTKKALINAKKKRTAKSKANIRKTFSTGILRRNPAAVYALVDVLNLGSATANDIAVQVFDWSSGVAVPLPVVPCNTPICKVTLFSGRSTFLYADVSKVEFKYEVRITRLAANKNVILNVTGVSGTPFTPQAGGTVLQHSLVEVKRKR
ncbi:hypothetical protein ACFPYJ_29265 [Paenibacillus solisilvae]|uniref:DUF3992 domain-containing protein n=1 Tax=Paenibacillus solisilvae TaxID=2486751 RepID=A0ABW0W7Z7_9BACL